ncbi:MAG: hypothetical protein E4H05_11130 [Acidimicrobiales bacterium]|nr:MAG: hypothetical protein E4H05_11130 [Acidimicrobiales bacterium]
MSIAGLGARDHRPEHDTWSIRGAMIAAMLRFVHLDRAVARPLVAAAIIVLGACGPPSPQTSSTVSEANTTAITAGTVDLDGVSAELIITRQRDLLDRGLVNVLVHNDSNHDLLITDRQLVSTFFDTTPAERRNTLIGAGRQIAVQVPYGSTEDCDDPTTVEAALVVTASNDAETTPVSVVRLDLEGTEILDGIRGKQCTARAFADATDTAFVGTTVDDQTVRTTLVITRTEGTADISLGTIRGTVLIGTRRIDDVTVDEMASTDQAIEIPLEFVVNRCDPHAMAEVTKRFGTEFEMSVDGSEPFSIPIDVTSLTPDFETIVQHCREQTVDVTINS